MVFSMRSLRIPVFFAMLAGMLCLPASTKMLMSPYLQAVSTNSIYVLVECDTNAPVTVDYGTKTAYGKTAVTELAKPTEANPPTYVHRIKLTGLKMDQRYHYRAWQEAGITSADATFVTAIKPGKDFRFCWLADVRTGTEIHAKIVTRLEAANPRFSIYGGDLCANNQYDMYKKEFFLPEELAFCARVPFFNSTGNHEGWGENTQAFTQSPQSASKTQDFYSFNYGDVHFLALNTELPYGDESPQYKFAAADLAAATQPWKIVFMHKPAYGAGGHGEDQALIAMSKQLFVPNHVCLVLNGHSHLYQHNLVDGIHHLIVGSGGAPLHDPGTAPYTVKSVKDYNYALIDVTKHALQITVQNADGKELDAITIARPK